MVFNSVSFLIFLPIFFTLYFLLSGCLKSQNCLILLASLVFYACWDYRFVFLLVFNTVIDYFFGLAIFAQRNPAKKRSLLILTIVMNLGILFFFKYFNFFIESVISTEKLVGIHTSLHTLNILLPIGISFYTFHSLSYTIDIYQGKLRPTKDYVAYASFVCFFPQLVAGPISRAKDMLPKFFKRREINSAKMISGLSQMTLGFFKKMAVADSLAVMVDTTYKNLHFVSDFQIAIAVFFYSVQIYCDFSGYSDIALGLGKIFGIEFRINFNRPYFSKNFSEFWERWHISLSSWLRDYLYIPLGGNRNGTFKTYRNLIITMLLGGLWHGASYNFIIWGGLHGFYLVIQRLFKIRMPRILSVLFTFFVTSLTWVFFRSHSLNDSIYVIEHLFTMKTYSLISLFVLIKLVYVVALMLFLDSLLFNYFDKRAAFAIPISVFLIVNIILFGTFSSSAFIYFQF